MNDEVFDKIPEVPIGTKVSVVDTPCGTGILYEFVG